MNGGLMTPVPIGNADFSRDDGTSLSFEFEDLDLTPDRGVSHHVQYVVIS